MKKKRINIIRKIVCLLVAGTLCFGLLAGCSLKKSSESSESNGADDAAWQIQYALGMDCLSKERYEEAVIAFSAAIDIRPNSSGSYASRADAYYEWGYSLLDESQQQTVTVADIPVQLSDEAAGKYELAVTDYEKARNLDPAAQGTDRNAIADTALVDYYREKGSEEKAQEYEDKLQTLIDDRQISDEVLEKIESHQQGADTNADSDEELATVYLLTESLWQPFQRANSEKSVYTYDTNGYLIRQDNYTVYDIDAQEEMLTTIIDYTVDEEGKVLSEVRTFSDTGEVLSTGTYNYDTEGRLIKEITYDEESDTYQWIDYVYNEEGNLEKATCWMKESDWDSADIETSTGGMLVYWRKYAYNEEGVLLNIFNYDDSGEEVLTSEETYDSSGNLTSSISYSPYGDPLLITYENTYDEYGNLLKQVELENGQIMIGTKTNTWQAFHK